MIGFTLNFHWSNFLKSAFHHSRPQFDDPSLGETNSGICAGEFGNPSGHSVITSQFLLQLNLLVRERIAKKWRLAFDVFIWIQILMVCACRLYLGRHSVDQILLGLVLGIGTACFFHFELRHLIYETIDRPTWHHFRVAMLIFFVMGL